MKIVDNVTSVVGGLEAGCLVQPSDKETSPYPTARRHLRYRLRLEPGPYSIVAAARRPRGWSRNGRARPHRDAEAAVTPLPARIVTARYGYSPRPTSHNGDACQALGKAPPDNLHWVSRSRLRTRILPIQLSGNSRGHSRRISPASPKMGTSSNSAQGRTATTS